MRFRFILFVLLYLVSEEHGTGERADNNPTPTPTAVEHSSFEKISGRAVIDAINEAESKKR